jgi:GNAT superfamily N-acetyltransferase
MKTILEPEQILLAEVDERPVGFCFAMPDLTPLFRGFKGKVGLLQIIKLMTRAKKYERGGILGLGVIDEFRGKGISKALAIKLYSFYQSKGLSSGFYYPVNENNRESRGFAESIGGKGQVTYQVYDKVLA